MRFGRFNGFPIRLGGGKAEAQRIYEGMRDGRGERFTRDDDSDDNKTLRCEARQIATAASYQRRGAYQAHATLATDMLPDWERRLGVVRNPRDNAYARRRLLGAILAGNGPPDVDTIEAALASAVGESVTILTTEAPALKTFSNIATPATGSVFVDSASRLTAGTHYVQAAWETATDVRACSTVASVIVSSGYAIRLNPLSLATVAGAYAIHWYMSVRADSQSLAHIGTTTTGAGFDVFDYPSNPGTPALHHVTAIVSAAVFDDQGQRNKIHEVLGSMLPAWTTYSLATSSGFELGVSLLGEDSF